MEDYKVLLEKAYSKVKKIEKSSERFEIPKLEGRVENKSTIITNINEIAEKIRRPVDNIIKFLQRELAAPVRMNSSKMIINSKINSSRVNEKLNLYVKEFVLCPVCAKPDTEIVSEKQVKIKHCLACGAKSPIKYNL
jgi:translation initiation factor 2 subunit 2